MAGFDAALTWWGVHIELAHAEVETVTSAHDIERELLSIAGGAPAPPYDLALAVAARQIAVEPSLIRELDQGDGISLTIPWTAIWWGQWWLVAPNTR
jgi:hypothetical protein